MPGKKKYKFKGSIDAKALSNSIIGVFTNNPRQSFNYKQVAKHLMAKSAEEKQLINVLLKHAELISNAYCEVLIAILS